MLTMQAELQDLVLKGYVWSFKACTHESSGPVLSQKEIRCIQAGMNNFIEARCVVFAGGSSSAGNPGLFVVAFGHIFQRSVVFGPPLRPLSDFCRTHMAQSLGSK